MFRFGDNDFTERSGLARRLPIGGKDDTILSI
jgi:hypothetical protein